MLIFGREQVDQDPLGKQGTRVYGSNLRGGGSNGWVSATTQSCNTSDPRQVWEYGSSNPTTPRGTLYNAASKLLLDVYECENLLALWPWVTDGCMGNLGFYFNFTSDQHIEATLRATTNCVQDNGRDNTMTLEQCSTSQAQQWALTSDNQVKSGNGNCLAAVDAEATGLNIWARPLSTGSTAFVFLNAGGDDVPQLDCDSACLKLAGVTSHTVLVRDLWAHKDLGVFPATNLTAFNLVANGGHSMLLITPQ